MNILYARTVYAMKVKIVELLAEGRRLPKQEALEKEPVEGELEIGYVEEGHNIPVPCIQIATLKVQYGTKAIMAQVIPPLLEPKMIRMTKTSFVLRGFQLSSSKGLIWQVAQEWWAKPISK